jgi:hypothetical protein
MSLFFLIFLSSSIQSQAFRQHLAECRLSLRINADAHAVKDDTTPLNVKLAGNLVGAMFSIKPLFKMASNKARSMMIDRASLIGVDWLGEVKELQSHLDVLSKVYDGLEEKSVTYPAYYLKPFHAYDEGNLSWKVGLYSIDFSRILGSALSVIIIFGCPQFRP